MKIVIYSLNDVITKFIYWKKIVIDTLNDTQKKYHKIIHKFCITKIAPQRWVKTCNQEQTLNDT